MRATKNSVVPRLGISECDVKVLFLEIYLPDVAVFISDNKFEK